MAKKVLMCGNEACGEGAVFAGCDFYAGYPITPQNELTAHMSRRMVEEKKAFVQAESEIAAINMVFGAALTGARAMTSSSSPGISLKQEGISYMVGCELPGVIVNVQRGGPGLGNIAPAQSDYFQSTKGGGHGDYHMVTLAPATVQEMFDLTQAAFDIADAYRNPVMVLADGLLGQMMEPIDMRVKSEPKKFEKSYTLTGCRGREPRIVRSLLLGDGELERHNIHLQEKFTHMTAREVRSEIFYQRDSEVVLVAYGSVARIAKSCMEKARRSGLKVGMIRPISLWPFPAPAIDELAQRGKKFLVIEMSAGQMVEDVLLATKGRSRVDFYGRMGGGIPLEEEIMNRIQALLR